MLVLDGKPTPLFLGDVCQSIPEFRHRLPFVQFKGGLYVPGSVLVGNRREKPGCHGRMFDRSKPDESVDSVTNTELTNTLV